MLVNGRSRIKQSRAAVAFLSTITKKYSAIGGTRTLNPLREALFESAVYANSTTIASKNKQHLSNIKIMF